MPNQGARSCQAIAHRGASSEAPENTLAAFRRAVELGADMIELDIQATRDGVLVVMHDEDVRRTTNGQGFVRQFLLDDLRQLDAGAWFGPTFAGEVVPTLEEVCAFAAHRVALNVEVKSTEGDKFTFVEPLLSCLRQYQMLETSIVSSFDPNVLVQLRQASDEVRLAFLYHRILAPAKWDELATLKPAALHPHHALLSSRLIDRLHSLGLMVNAWTVDNPRRMVRLLTWGVDGIITNNPGRLKTLLDRSRRDQLVS